MRAQSLVHVIVGVGFAVACASGKATPRDLPASTAVSAEDIERTPSVPIEELLMAKYPGVWIQRMADGGLSIRIRGATSLEASNEPLYIVDGTPIQAGPNGSLTGIVASDIASIEILKDAAGTTMYGVRGANGVIIIKTKQGRR